MTLELLANKKWHYVQRRDGHQPFAVILQMAESLPLEEYKAKIREARDWCRFNTDEAWSACGQWSNDKHRFNFKDANMAMAFRMRFT